MFMMHLRGLAVFLLSFPGGARRSIRIDHSHYDAQQQNNSLAKSLEVSAEAREALIPQFFGTRGSRQPGLQIGAWRPGSKHNGRLTGHLEPHRAARWLHFGPRRAKVALQAASGLEEDEFPAKEFGSARWRAALGVTGKGAAGKRKRRTAAPFASLPRGSDVPTPWTQYETEQGETYFYNPETGESVWELPKTSESDASSGLNANDRSSVPSAIIDNSNDRYVAESEERLRQERMDRLAADVARFKDENVNTTSMNDEQGILQKVIDTLGTVLTYNFFIIIGFFIWFLAGVGLQFGAKELAVIGAFRSLWDPLILPLLSTHMGLTFLSAGLERLAKMGD